MNTGVYRPVISEGSTVDPLHGFVPAAVSGPPGPPGPVQVKHLWSMFSSHCMQTILCPLPVLFGPTGLLCSSCCFVVQVPPSHGAGLEGPKWVSRWASLADSYADPGSTPPQGDCSEGAVQNQSHVLTPPEPVLQTPSETRERPHVTVLPHDSHHRSSRSCFAP